jgi:hypothetical protein
LLKAAEEQELDVEDARRLGLLTELDSQLNGELHRCSELMIAEHYFPDYAEQFASDIGAIDDNYTWPHCHIDWKAAADSLAMDYTIVEFDGDYYYMRGY